jgi:hypothetical protein
MATATINGRDMVLLIDSLDRSDETSNIAFGPGTRTTYGDMRAFKPKRLDMTITQDLTSTSLYRMALAGLGEPVTGMFKPLGNVAPSTAQPHYSFNVQPAPASGDTIMGTGAEADASKPGTVDVQWLITDWTEVTA